MRIVSALLLVLLWTAPTLAAPAISCHCFQDRSFDPQRPAAADPYLLATTQNSFFAAVFGLEKKEVVRAKMTGSSAPELWVSRFVAQRGGVSVTAVEKARGEHPDWRAALAALAIPPKRLGPEFAAALAGPGTAEALASAAVDATLAARLHADPAELKRLRAAGASDAETILAVFLSRESGRPASSFRNEVAAGKRTWGELLATLGVDGAAIEGEVRRLLG